MGCEREAEYVGLARERITAYFNGTLKTRPMGKPVHVPTGKEKVAQVPDEWKKTAQKNLLLEKKRKYQF
jgi:adenine-specific DNA-methyltransferase